MRGTGGHRTVQEPRRGPLRRSSGSQGRRGRAGGTEPLQGPSWALWRAMWAPLPCWGVLAPPGGAWGPPVAWWVETPRQITRDMRQQITGRSQLAHINWHTSALISDQ
jgi:hypothetical protein